MQRLVRSLGVVLLAEGIEVPLLRGARAPHRLDGLALEGAVHAFVGTRVPVLSLFDYLEAGDSLEEFLHQFPSVRRAQAVAALEYARDQVMAGARPS